MTIEYPDIVSEYVDALERYEVNGVQVVPCLEPPDIPAGGYAMLILLLQSVVNTPVGVTIKIDLPSGGLFKGGHLLEIGQTEHRIDLNPAQVGSLFIPIKVAEDAREGQHEIRLNVKVSAAEQGSRVRPSQTNGRFRCELVEDVVGLELARFLGVPYSTKTQSNVSLPFTIKARALPGQGESVEARTEHPTLEAKFEALWSTEEADLQSNALQEVHQRSANIVDQLQKEGLYVALLVEGQDRFAQAALPLRVGEAIALAKILTYTAEVFLSSRDLQDGLLAPMWELALKYDLSTDDPMWVIRNVGFQHLLRLSVAVSFGLIRKALGSQPWDLEERRTLVQFIPNAIEAGEQLGVEFLYIPLLAASTTIFKEIVLDSEQVEDSLKLLRQAKQARADAFSDPELAQVNQIFDQLLDVAFKQTAS